MMNYDGLPEHMQDGIKLYIEKGIEPGGFLCAVLKNNLVESFGCADNINRVHMFDWVLWLYNECPRGAWGSPEIVNTWINEGGLMGVENGNSENKES